jgi:glycosyltransferase involved in cell wall biosynthesis
MRVAVVNWTDRIAGGAERYLDAVLPALAERGHHVHLWHETTEPVGRTAVRAIRDVVRTCVADAGLEPAVRALRAWTPDVLFVQRLDNPAHEAALLDVSPAVFLAHDYHGTCISGAKTFTFPVVRPCGRTFGPACLVQYFPRRCGGLSPVTMLREYSKQNMRLGLLRRYASVATFSAHMREEYLNHGFEAARVHHLPPVDTMRARLMSADGSDTASRHLSGERADRVRLAFIGRLDRLKGCAMLLDALPGVRTALGRRVTLTVAGDGPDLARCQDKARIIEGVADVGVTFIGWSSAERCEELLDASDVLVVPSLWPEPFGLVGLEARRRGVPVAAFRVGGIPEWLTDGEAGALAPADPPTSAGLAKAIVRCVESADINAAVRRRTTDLRDEFSPSHHLDALVELLQDAISTHQ